MVKVKAGTRLSGLQKRLQLVTSHVLPTHEVGTGVNRQLGIYGQTLASNYCRLLSIVIKLSIYRLDVCC